MAETGGNGDWLSQLPRAAGATPDTEWVQFKPGGLWYEVPKQLEAPTYQPPPAPPPEGPSLISQATDFVGGNLQKFVDLPQQAWEGFSGRQAYHENIVANAVRFANRDHTNPIASAVANGIKSIVPALPADLQMLVGSMVNRDSFLPETTSQQGANVVSDQQPFLDPNKDWQNHPLASAGKTAVEALENLTQFGKLAYEKPGLAAGQLATSIGENPALIAPMPGLGFGPALGKAAQAAGAGYRAERTAEILGRVAGQSTSLGALMAGTEALHEAGDGDVSGSKVAEAFAQGAELGPIAAILHGALKRPVIRDTYDQLIKGRMDAGTDATQLEGPEAPKEGGGGGGAAAALPETYEDALAAAREANVPEEHLDVVTKARNEGVITDEEARGSIQQAIDAYGEEGPKAKPAEPEVKPEAVATPAAEQPKPAEPAPAPPEAKPAEPAAPAPPKLSDVIKQAREAGVDEKEIQQVINRTLRYGEKPAVGIAKLQQLMERGPTIVPGSSAFEATGVAPANDRGLPIVRPDETGMVHTEVAGQPVSVNVEPTDLQKQSGNYAKGHVVVQGIPITIENPAGTERKGVSPEGTPWTSTLSHDYGYIKRTTGADGDHVDAFVGPNPESQNVYVIDQHQPGGEFDEHKAMVGFNSQQQAVDSYHANYPAGWDGAQHVTEMPVDQFKKWLSIGDTRKALKPQAIAPSQPVTPPAAGGPTAAPSQEGVAPTTGAPQTLREQLAERKAARQKLVSKPRAGDERTDSMLRWLAKHPRGIDFDQAIAEGFDKADLNNSAPARWGIKRAFRRGGMTFDHAAEVLHEAGYPVTNAEGNYDPHVMAEAIDRELRGTPVYSHNRSQASMEAEARRHAEDEALRKEIEIASPGYGSQPQGAQELTILAERARQHDEDATDAALEAQTDEEAARRLHAIIEAGEAKQQGVGQAQPEGAGPAPAEPLLSGYTQADLDRRAAAETQSAAAEQARREMEAHRAESERNAGNFDLTGSNLPADANPRQTDLLSATGRPAAVTPSKNTIFTEDAAAKARERLRAKLGTARSGIDPEMLQDGLTLTGYHIERGARTFVAYAKAMVSDMGKPVKPFLKSWYMAVKYDPRAATFSKEMSAAHEVESTDVEGIESEQEPSDVQRPGESTESGRAGGVPENGVVPTAVQPERRAEEQGVGGAGPSAGDNWGAPEGGLELSGGGAPTGGEPGDQSFRLDGGRFGTPGTAAGGNERPRGANGGAAGTADDAAGNNEFEPSTADAARRLDLEEKRAAQRAAEPIPVVNADAKNVAATLPYLMPSQHEDVLFAEQRFAKPDGYGVLFANGTGTGKTFVGLGAIKRMVKQGKGNGLIVVPSQKILNDWVRSGAELGLTINPLTDLQDAGKGVAITTYANFAGNLNIGKRDYDFIVNDEAHNLMQNAAAGTTAALQALRAISLHPDGVFARARMLHQDAFNELDAANAARNALGRSGSISDLDKANARIRAALDAWKPLVDAVSADVTGRQGAARPRVLWLSATPFAYEKNVAMAEGYLFNFGNDQQRGYNQPAGFDAFMVQHFGYRMRYNKLTEPDANVDRGLMQRQFNTWMRRQGVLSTRMLEVDADYNRKFVSVESNVGQKIDEGLQWLRETDKGRFRPLLDKINDRFDFLARSRLLEALKAKEMVPYIRGHLDAGRKVVAFYDYNEGGAFNVFQLPQFGDEDTVYTGSTPILLKHLAAEFASRRPDLVGLDTKAPSVLQTLTRAFPRAMQYNGLISAKRRIKFVDDFNDDDKPEANLILAQKAANAGWSAHDTTGKNQRVLINLGLPTAPVVSIQQEGRIYRIGNVSNAMFRYVNTGTTWERTAFASTISQRASTAENLAMGEQARGLKDAFINAFEQSAPENPKTAESTGGKQEDRSIVQAPSDFQRAKSLYYGQLKKTAATKAREGADYFATPEPLGVKMVEWAGIRPGDHVLEPSAGHGAIARWFPEHLHRTVIEPSQELASRLALVTDAKLINEQFEQHHVVNKYDAIVMNPPFGTAGRTAIDHLEKATTHLRDGGRVVAIIPTGPAADAKFDKWLYGKDGEEGAKGIYLAADIKLPRETFERAGTSAATRIVVLDKLDDPSRAVQPVTRDYTDATRIGHLFDRIEDTEVPPRPLPVAEAPAQTAAAPSAGAAGGAFTPSNAKHSRTGGDIFYAHLVNRVSGDVYSEWKAAASKLGGYYSPFKKGTTKPGFIFKTAADRDAFISQYAPKEPLLARGAGEPTTALKPEVGEYLNKVRRALSGIAQVMVHDTPADFGKVIDQGVPNDVYGAYTTDDNTLHFIASNLPDVETAKEIFLHEGFGHMAMEKSPDFAKALAMVGRLREMGGKKINDIYDRVFRQYPDISEADRAKEVIAAMAESGINNSVIDRAKTGVLELLRKVGIDVKPDDAELRQLIVQAARGLPEEARNLAGVGVRGDTLPGETATPQARPLFARRATYDLKEPEPRPGAYEAARKVVTSLWNNELAMGIRRGIDPVNVSDYSKEAARVLRADLGALAQHSFEAQSQLEQFASAIDRLSPRDQLQIIDDIENGRPQSVPGMQPVANLMRQMLDDWRTKIQSLGVGALENFLENYFPHYWQNKTRAQKLMGTLMGRRPLKGSGAFLKKRTVPDTKTGIEAGLRPLTINPLLLTLLKLREMQRFYAGTKTMQNFRRDGLARFLRAGRSVPEGWAEINDYCAKVRQWSEAEQGFIERGRYIMPEDAARVVNNHLSASKLQNVAIAQVARLGTNLINSLQLGLSAFHLGFTTLDAMISKNALAIERMLHGEPLQAAKALLEGLTPAGAAMNVARGMKLLRAYSNISEATPEMRQIVRALQAGGGRVKMDDYYMAGRGLSPFHGTGLWTLSKDIHAALTADEGQLAKLAKTLGSFPVQYATRLFRDLQAIGKTYPKWQLPFEIAGRVVRAASSVIMEHIVPLQKLGVFSDLAADYIRRNPEADPKAFTEAMQSIWNSVDNRLGEMVYDNLFWNRTFKDVTHLMVRAVGWNLGTFREIGGAGTDVIRLADQLMGGRRGGGAGGGGGGGSDEAAGAAEPEPGSRKITADDVGHRIPYTMAVVGTTAIIAAIYMYLHTGHGPQESKDYAFPQTGGTTKYGTPERASMPSYVKDMYEYYQAPGATLLHKLNPAFGIVGDMLSNEDFYGHAIADPTATFPERVGQDLSFLGQQITPFSLQGRQKFQPTATSPAGKVFEKASPFIGVTAAPGRVTAPEQLNRAADLRKAESYLSGLHYQILDAQRSGDTAREEQLMDKQAEVLDRVRDLRAQVRDDRADMPR